MRTTDCAICQAQSIPLNDTINVDLKTYCGPCFEKEFTNEDQLRGRLVEKHRDPTVCAYCDKDFDTVELKKLSEYPVCRNCEKDIEKKTFPLWVKCFMAGLAAMIILGVVWNWKYYEAYKNVKRFADYSQQGDFGKAAAAIASASKTVPESEDLEVMTNYARGLDLLIKDSSEQALRLLNLCKGKLPADYNLDPLILRGRVGATFDSKDYDGFLAATREYLVLNPTDPNALTAVASAYACLYATKSQEQSKDSSVAFLDRAKATGDTTADLKSYINMVEYRLDSKQIIRSEAFKKTFPNGWTKN